MLRNLLARFRPNGRAVPAGCEHVQSRLLSYLDRDLGPAERSLVESHLEHCASCRAEMAAYRRVETVLGSAAATIPSPGDLRAEFYTRLEQSRRRKSISPWLVAVPALAGTAAMLFVWGHRGSSVVHVKEPLGGSSAVTARTGNGTTSQPGSHVGVNGNGKAEQGPKLITSIEPPQKRFRVFRSPESSMAMIQRPRRAYDFLGRSIKSVHKQATLVASVVPVPSVDAITTFGRRSSKAVDAPLALYNTPEQPQDDRNAIESRDTALGYRTNGRVALTSLVTELHVSDENRDFMSSTHVDTAVSLKSKVETLNIDEDNDNAQESAELPALP